MNYIIIKLTPQVLTIIMNIYISMLFLNVTFIISMYLAWKHENEENK